MMCRLTYHYLICLFSLEPPPPLFGQVFLGLVGLYSGTFKALLVA